MLFSAKTNPSLFERSEIIALINTINRFSESLRAVDKFRKMYQAKTNPIVSICLYRITQVPKSAPSKLTHVWFQSKIRSQFLAKSRLVSSIQKTIRSDA